MTHLFDPHFQTNASTGAPNAGALLYFFATGTTTPITTYADSGKITPSTTVLQSDGSNAIVADSAGLFVPIYVDTNTYKVVLKTAALATIQTIDPVLAPLIAGGQALFADGSVGAPSISFTADPDTGMYRVGTNNLGIVANGVKQIDVSAVGVTMTTGIATALFPFTTDGAALGTTSKMWSDLFLASGAVVNFNNGNVTVTHSAAQLTIAGGSLRLAAGTTSKPPLQFFGGALATSPGSGYMEHETATGLLYFTDFGGSRGLVPFEQFSILASDFTGTNVNTAQPVFSSAQDVFSIFNVAATYEFEAEYQIDTTGTTSNSLGTLFGGTAVVASISYSASSTNGTARATPSAPAVSRSEVATVFNVTAAVAAVTQRTVRLRGTLRIAAGGGGTLIPQFQFSAAPGAAPTIRKDSFFRIWPIGIDTVASLGAWA